MTTTIGYLTNGLGFPSQILGCLERFSYPDCGELRWDFPECGPMTEDTGIALKAGARSVVLSLLTGQLRYYAASENVDEIDYEIGVFPDAASACQFAEGFLIQKLELLAIRTPRTVLRAGLEARGESAVNRPHTDEADRRSSS